MDPIMVENTVKDLAARKDPSMYMSVSVQEMHWLVLPMSNSRPTTRPSTFQIPKKNGARFGSVTLIYLHVYAESKVNKRDKHDIHVKSIVCFNFKAPAIFSARFVFQLRQQQKSI
mmetsp:Transcript_1396/g.2839  ORF Transcript_1396/g.2839 Transcript_1396/m.2839 type:complete len:115 (+) Transcript_1396:900-1244(+)